MKHFYSYEDAAFDGRGGSPVPIVEYMSGSDIVGWYGRIESQLIDKIEQEEANRNNAYADKLRAFLKLWRENEIRGSINREPVDALKAATDILAVDTWSLASYFRALRDSLRQLIAKIEELPYDDMSGPEDEEPGPPHSNFGPEATSTSGVEGSDEPSPDQAQDQNKSSEPEDQQDGEGFDLDNAVDALKKKQGASAPV